MTMSRFLAALGMTLAVAVSGCADARQARHEIRDETKATGHAIRNAATELGHATRDAAKRAGHATRDAVHEAHEDLKKD